MCFVPGEDIHTSLYGAAVDVNIRLDRNSLTVEKTYLTLSNHRSVVVHNQSEIIAHFHWKPFVNQEEEDQQKLRFVSKIHFRKTHCPGPREVLVLLNGLGQVNPSTASGYMSLGFQAM